MKTRPGSTAKNIAALAAAALVALPAAFASAADGPSGATASPLIVPGARYQLVDARRNVVGELVSETGTRLRLRPIGATTALRAAQKQPLSPAAGTTFHPDDGKALTVGQMSAAWQAELDRINPPFVTGGG